MPVDLTKDTDDDNVKYVKAYGRWVERLIPAGEGLQYIAASIYGISGASSDSQDYDDNERLVKAAYIRMAQMQDIPYILGADANVNPAHSDSTKYAIENGILYDTFSDAYGGNPPPTFRKGNIIAEMDGDGVSRIDTIFCNPSANHAVLSLNYGIREAASFDHVLL